MLNKPSQSTKRILCVDDNADSRELIAVVLNGGGYEVVPSACCQEAIPLAREGGFAAIILDNWFPDGDGPDLCREIRNNDQWTPILFYSAAAYPADIDRALSVGAQAYLVKPNGLEEILPTLARLVNVAADMPIVTANTGADDPANWPASAEAPSE
ncbi:MAG TPA: response regulator [Blastocatellia bacterium]|jgi:CheY-like chemotaxis protein|nr:response regulator [Blastocatellia bacterium]